jgi:hypothetical protein
LGYNTWICSVAFFIHRKSLLPGCEAIHCGGVEPTRDLHTLVVVLFACLVLFHAQEAVNCYCIRAAFVSKLSNIYILYFEAGLVHPLFVLHYCGALSACLFWACLYRDYIHHLEFLALESERNKGFPATKLVYLGNLILCRGSCGE